MPEPLRLQDIPGEVVEVAQYAALFHLSTRYVYEQLRTGQIPCVRIGTRVFVPRWYADQVAGMKPAVDAGEMSRVPFASASPSMKRQ